MRQILNSKEAKKHKRKRVRTLWWDEQRHGFLLLRVVHLIPGLTFYCFFTAFSPTQKPTPLFAFIIPNTHLNRFINYINISPTPSLSLSLSSLKPLALPPPKPSSSLHKYHLDYINSPFLYIHIFLYNLPIYIHVRAME